MITDRELDFAGDRYSSDQPLGRAIGFYLGRYSCQFDVATWCPKCTEEIPEIANYYSKWKQQDIEGVYVSLDENEQQFKSFVRIFPFVSVCDYQKWASPIVKNYYMFATPTMYLLDDKRKILLRPTSVGHLDAWVDWNLVQGEK